MPAPSTLPFNAIQVLAANGALLAFIVGLYSLVGRERKAPYISNQAFKIFFISALAATIDVAAVISPWRPVELLYIGTTGLFVTFFMAFWQAFRIYRRFVCFVDSRHPKHFGVVRLVKAMKRRFSDKTEYEYNAKPLDDDFMSALTSNIEKAIGKTHDVEFREHLGNTSIAVALDHHGQSNSLLASICTAFLEKGYRVQYMTASRHPIEFIDYLFTALSTSGVVKQDAAENIIVVDGYTPHFGFIDSIYKKRTQQCAQKHGVTLLPAKTSYAGIHTSCQDAFNRWKTREKSKVRSPILVIYENMYAISDLESSEQYRIFVRHVLPSEKLWGGMLTLFTEVNPAEADWSILSSYASMEIDLRRTAATNG